MLSTHPIINVTFLIHRSPSCIRHLSLVNSTTMSNLQIPNLFSVQGLVAVITGGGSGTSPSYIDWNMPKAN